MDWLDNMNAAMEYIETHLSDEIFYNRAAQLACCSTYHFQRMFSYITGVPLSEYIRRGRLTFIPIGLGGILPIHFLTVSAVNAQTCLSCYGNSQILSHFVELT